METVHYHCVNFPLIWPKVPGIGVVGVRSWNGEAGQGGQLASVGPAEVEDQPVPFGGRRPSS